MIRDINKSNEFESIIKNLPNDTVIGEFAGRDSVAAILKALEDESITTILPIASFAPTEYGDFQILESNFLQMVERIKQVYGNTKRIEPLIYYSSFDLWSIINGRFVKELHQRYGFYTPCIGCHAYFHLLRMPVALRLGKKIISGERESHDGKIKINQSEESLDAYKVILKHFGVELIMPIRLIKDGKSIENLIGWDWREGKGHQTCAFSGNYKDVNGDVDYDKEIAEKYLKEFLIPICITLGELMIENHEVSIEKMIQAIKNRGDLF